VVTTFYLLIVEATFMEFKKLCISVKTAVLQYMAGQVFITIWCVGVKATFLQCMAGQVFVP
jgi:hypothetical protein